MNATIGEMKQGIKNAAYADWDFFILQKCTDNSQKKERKPIKKNHRKKPFLLLQRPVTKPLPTECNKWSMGKVAQEQNTDEQPLFSGFVCSV